MRIIVYKVFDHNNDAYIDHEEIKRTMHFLGETVSDDDVRAMIKEADADHDGLVDFEGQSSNVFDHNNDAYIDHEEIKRTMHFLGETVSDDDVRAMIKEADADHDGLVDFEGQSSNVKA
ncbi:Calmodulin [Echinococcus granulosus]|uniref:Calmodulin n=1 Tax=Echinococcus granulosus TaxID=6210 RepID=W6TZK4_ECHGR|nr:Calmodulin [Echinococcus granulosus]EUB54255.1 Calmodulin [Echinococcus granulosus]